MTDQNCTVKLYENCVIAEDVVIGEFSVIGKPERPIMACGSRGPQSSEPKTVTRIDSGCYISTHVLIEEGVLIKSGCVIEAHTFIGSCVSIGRHTFIVQGARIGKGAQISDHCVIGGIVSERTVIGSGSRVFGSLIHRQDRTDLSWDQNIEMAPRIGDNVFIGRGALIIGPVDIPSEVYVCAGAIVTKNMSSGDIVSGFNERSSRQRWKGRLSQVYPGTPDEK